MLDDYTSHCHSNPSFSSTLLDYIYRSFDLGEEGMGIYREPIKNNKKIGADVLGGGLFRSEEEMANFQRVCMIEKLMEKRVGDKGVSRRKFTETVADLREKKWRKDGGNLSFSSSSDSSSGGGEADEILFVRRPKPIRTGHEKEISREYRQDFEMNRRQRLAFADQLEPKPKHEGGFQKTKSKALKIYGDLKKVKQPISPGGKLATFLNSLFTTASGSSKKQKPNANPHHSPPSKSASTSTCSSASSFSRSCLSKPVPSNTGKFSSIAKRSVKFFPVSVIVDEDSQPFGETSLHPENKPINRTLYSELAKSNNGVNNVNPAIDEELMVHVMEYNRRVEDAAMEFLRKTHFTNRVFDREFEEQNEDDMESCASSDLFELDNLSAIGEERYMKELPVYETTSVGANRIIVN